MSSVLILGNGFLGSRLYSSLNDTKGSGNVSSVQVFSKKDLDYTNIENLYRDDVIAPDIVINASGFTGQPNVDGCESSKPECWKLNTQVPVSLYDYCRHNGILFIHISSGCIYSGYDKHFTEEDEPNFGMFSDVSSFYSKTKHAAELLMPQSSDLLTFRIRIPFTGDNTSRNYINKLLNYNELISMDNSITCVEEFVNMITMLIATRDIYKVPYGTYNACNPEPVNAQRVIELLKKRNVYNPNWSVIDIKNLNTVANRSNCILSTDKIQSIGDWFKPTIESLELAIDKLCDDTEFTKKYIH